MADFAIPGEFEGNIGTQHDLFSIQFPFGVAVRPTFVIASPTNSAGTLDLYQLGSTPPASAWSIPTLSQRLWSLTSSGDSVTAHLDSPVTFPPSIGVTQVTVPWEVASTFIDRFAGGDSVGGPSSGQTIASAGGSAIGTYDVWVTVGTNVGRASDFGNMGLYLNSTLITKLSNPVGGIESSGPYRYSTSSTTDFFHVKALDVGTGGAKYSATISGIRVK